MDHFADFETLFGTKPSAITAAAKQPRAHASQLLQLGTDLHKDSRMVGANVAGDITDLGRAPTHPARTATHLGTTGLVAAGCLKKFGHAATHFDSQVETLNLQWDTIHSKQVCLSPDAPTAEQLQHQYARDKRALEAEAQSAADLLRHPNDIGNVRMLFDEGFIPLSALSHWPGLEKLIVKEVNDGKVVDPKLALSLPWTMFSDDGRKALANWVKTHGATVGKLLLHGAKLNLPPDPNGYRLDIKMFDSPTLKLHYILTLAAGAGATSVVFTGGAGNPSLTGMLTDGKNTAMLNQDGFSVRSAIAQSGDDSTSIQMEKDGPWVVHTHTQEMSDDNEMETEVEVRPTGDGNDPGSEPDTAPATEPETQPHHSPVSSLLHGIAHGAEEVGGAVKDGVTSLPGHAKDVATGTVHWFGNEFQNASEEPHGIREAEYAGLGALAALAVVGAGGAAAAG